MSHGGGESFTNAGRARRGVHIHVATRQNFSLVLGSSLLREGMGLPPVSGEGSVFAPSSLFDSVFVLGILFVTWREDYLTRRRSEDRLIWEPAVSPDLHAGILYFNMRRALNGSQKDATLLQATSTSTPPTRHPPLNSSRRQQAPPP